MVTVRNCCKYTRTLITENRFVNFFSTGLGYLKQKGLCCCGRVYSWIFSGNETINRANAVALETISTGDKVDKDFQISSGDSQSSRIPSHSDGKSRDFITKDYGVKFSRFLTFKLPDVDVPATTATPPVDIENLYLAIKQSTRPLKELQFNVGCMRFKANQLANNTLVQTMGDFVSSDDVFLPANHVSFNDSDRFGENADFVLSEYPLEKHFAHFWKLCHGASVVVDLSDINDELEYDLAKYAPEAEGESLTLGNGEIQVVCLSKKNLNQTMTLYTYQTLYKEKRSAVNRLHFNGWDNDGYINAQALSYLLSVIDYFEILEEGHPLPCVLHCVAGIGRSGTLAATYHLHKLIQQGKINAENFEETIKEVIIGIREMRSRLAVTSQSQLKAIVDWAWIALEAHLQMPRGLKTGSSVMKKRSHRQ